MRYNYLEVVREFESNKHGNKYLECRCVCGNIYTGRAYQIRNGSKKSCGCMDKPKNHNEHRKVISEGDEIKINNARLVQWIKTLAKQAETNPTQWCEELLEDWIREHRSCKDPIRSEENITEEAGDEEYAIGY